MTIVVFGGSGLIGTKLVQNLRELGNEVIPASPRTGIDALTGEGLPDALAGARVAVDVMNSPSWEDSAVLKFFETSTCNLLAAEAKAGVRHHIALSVVGTERLQERGFFGAKMAQEHLIAATGMPYTIVRASQFFEFIGAIAKAGTDGQVVRLPPALMQPMSADDVAAALADFTVGQPLNNIVEIAGPEAFGIDEAVRRFLVATGDAHHVATDATAPYYGIKVNERTLMPAAAPGSRPLASTTGLVISRMPGQSLSERRHQNSISLTPINQTGGHLGRSGPRQLKRSGRGLTGRFRWPCRRLQLSTAGVEPTPTIANRSSAPRRSQHLRAPPIALCFQKIPRSMAGSPTRQAEHTSSGSYLRFRLPRMGGQTTRPRLWRLRRCCRFGRPMNRRRPVSGPYRSVSAVDGSDTDAMRDWRLASSAHAGYVGHDLYTLALPSGFTDIGISHVSNPIFGQQFVGSGSVGALGTTHAMLWNGTVAVDLHPTNLPGFDFSNALGTDGHHQVGFGGNSNTTSPLQPGTRRGRVTGNREITSWHLRSPRRRNGLERFPWLKVLQRRKGDVVELEAHVER